MSIDDKVVPRGAEHTRAPDHAERKSGRNDDMREIENCLDVGCAESDGRHVRVDDDCDRKESGRRRPESRLITMVSSLCPKVLGMGSDANL